MVWGFVRRRARVLPERCWHFPEYLDPLFTSDLEVFGVAEHYIGIVGPAYAGLGIGLVLYFASQGAGAMRWPVFRMVLRFIISVGGAGFCVLHLNIGLEAIFYAGAIGMSLYAIFIATAIFKGMASQLKYMIGLPPRGKP